MRNFNQKLARLWKSIPVRLNRSHNNWRMLQLNRKVTAHAKLTPGQRPVAFFNASTRITGLSLNAAFSFLTACGLQLAGAPVVHFACKGGMSRCVLGTNRDDASASPPCKPCVAQSGWIFANAPTFWFEYKADPDLAAALQGLSVESMSKFEHQGRPLGSLVLPSLRWALRRHNLKDDETTRLLFREYISSANVLVNEFSAFLDQADPAAVVVFNGTTFPEATARWVARRRGVRVITHEVALQPFTAFFTDGQATAYPIDIPEEFELTPEQDARLDAYLEQRFQGKFTMAGVRFWPEMSRLDEAFLQRAAGFRQIVPVFTNVIFDTSQIHANRVFEHMFAWLDMLLEIIPKHPDTLFVLRAHPDEQRAGKESRESVEGWAARRQIAELPNVVFIPPREYISSYELIQRSKFVMVYNSSIGLEASLMGAAVLSGGKARYTRLPTVYFPQTPEAYREQAETFLKAGEIETPVEFKRNARRFLYYQLFKTSLPFDDFLAANRYLPGFVDLRPFHWQRLTVPCSPTMHALVKGILEGRPFLLEDGAIEAKPC